MPTRNILQVFAAAALSLTALTHCAYDQSHMGRFFVDDRTQAYVFSSLQKAALLQEKKSPMLVCFPDHDRILQITQIVHLGPELKAQTKTFPDSIVVAQAQPGRALMLRYTDGQMDHAIFENLIRLATQVNQDRRENLITCVTRFKDKQLDEQRNKDATTPLTPDFPLLQATMRAEMKPG